MLTVGIFVNMFLVAIFPYQFLDTTSANVLLGEDELGYNFNGNSYFTQKHGEAVETYTDLSDDSQLNSLSDTDAGVSGGETITNSNFFDGLFSALTKIKSYLAFIIPFASMFFLLPGAFGLIFGTLYSMGMAFAFLRWIRGV